MPRRDTIDASRFEKQAVRVLWLLHERGEPMTRAEIAEALDWTVSFASRVTNVAEGEGFIKRYPGMVNGRGLSAYVNTDVDFVPALPVTDPNTPRPEA